MFLLTVSSPSSLCAAHQLLPPVCCRGAPATTAAVLPGTGGGVGTDNGGGPLQAPLEWPVALAVAPDEVMARKAAPCPGMGLK